MRIFLAGIIQKSHGIINFLPQLGIVIIHSFFLILTDSKYKTSGSIIRIFPDIFIRKIRADYFGIPWA